MKIGDIVTLSTDMKFPSEFGAGLIVGFEEIFENEYEPIVFWNTEYPYETEYASSLVVEKAYYPST